MSRGADTDSNDHTGEERSANRGGFLKKLGAGALAVGAATAFGRTESASAGVDGDVVAGGATATTAETLITVSGGSTLDAGLYVNATAATAATAGVRGDSSQIGVVGSGAGTGVVGSGGALGGFFSGSSVALSLDPQSSAGPASSGFRGDLLVDSHGVPWLCIADGSPGTWIRAGGPQVLANPVRAYDSRPGQPDFANPTKTPLADGGGGNVGAVRNINLASYGPLGIPAGAGAVLLNLTVINTTGIGWLAAWPGPSSNPYPGTSNINWTTGGAIIANFAVVGLGTDGTINLAAARPTDVIVDVAGYII